MSFEKVKDIFKRKRAIEILQLLDEAGEVNYNSLNEEVESSSDTISTTLKILVDHHLVKRTQRNVNDVRYSLTREGKQALEILKKLRDIIEEKQ
jgi:DNA-binding HxlR family transcriptional regulator